MANLNTFWSVSSVTALLISDQKGFFLKITNMLKQVSKSVILFVFYFCLFYLASSV
jgi:hypothetical protein